MVKGVGDTFFSEIFHFFVGGSCEVGSNWVFDCSLKPSKLLLPTLEGAWTVNGDSLMSDASASYGAGTCGGMGEKNDCRRC
jgi:hypothetical protein